MAFQPIPNYVDKPGLVESLEAAGFSIVSLNGVMGTTSDLAAVQAFIAAYDPLPWNKARKQEALDALFDSTFDLPAFIRGGTATNVTGSAVGTFLAANTNNYRSKRAAIAGAASQAALDSVNISAGWPSNP